MFIESILIEDGGPLELPVAGGDPELDSTER
jgi:hypothetical protein